MICIGQVIRALLDLCQVGTTTIRKRCVAAIWNMTNVEQDVQEGGSAAESIPLLLVNCFLSNVLLQSLVFKSRHLKFKRWRYVWCHAIAMFFLGIAAPNTAATGNI